MSWVVLAPAGVDVQVLRADVAEPWLLPAAELERFARYETLAKGMRDLGLEPPPYNPTTTPESAPAAIRDVKRPDTPPEAYNGVSEAVSEAEFVGMRSFTTREEILACICGATYGLPNDDPELNQAMRLAYKRHRAQCGTAQGHRNLDGAAEEGGFTWAQG